ncbi:MAG TPA: serine hydrolase domain-containing protein [Chloroflexota bacterium]|nr:serine hydrolase domain-containing protein [Chloroflexota bacterium]
MAIALDKRAFVEADPDQVGMDARRIERVSRVFRELVDAGQLPGFISLVARHGKNVHFDCYGSADMEAGKPIEPDTIFRIYSMTKPIVSVALMTLYEEGRFQLDDPASKHVPELKGMRLWAGGTADKYDTREPTREMTVRDLLMHTSGLPGGGPGSPLEGVGELYRRNDVRVMRNDETLAEFVAKLGRMPLAYDPGSQWVYGISTDLVGYLCEVFSGQPLDRFLKERIFEPLDMPDTGFWTPAGQEHRLAANYRSGNVGEPPLVLVDAPASSAFARPKTYFSGVGGLVSTAHDYMRFGKMLANGGELEGHRVLGPRTLQLMAMNHLPGGCDIASLAKSGGPAPKGDGFGLGFAVCISPVLTGRLGSPGEYYWSGAASTEFFVSPRDDLFALFLTQVMNNQLARDLRSLLRVTTYQALTD